MTIILKASQETNHSPNNTDATDTQRHVLIVMLTLFQGPRVYTAHNYLNGPKLTNNGPHIDPFLAKIIDPIWTQRLENIDPIS